MKADLRIKKGLLISNSAVKYSLVERIGSGGSGVVWKAKADKNYYAVKFIESTDNSKIERFNKELEFCKNNQHKNIVSIIADGTYKGRRYYIMPLYSKTLRDIINEETDVDILVKYILQLCYAVQFIHKHKSNVTHRDIKPENILIDGKKLVLADFGIAHFIDSTLTKKSDLLANRNYAAPEQKIKGGALEIEKSADIYALGLIINECFTKQNPAGSSYKIIADNYPLYYEFDTLVYNMIKQSACERFFIEDVITELKFAYGKVKQNSQKIKDRLVKYSYPDNIGEKTYTKIIQRASEDLLVAKIIFEKKTNKEFEMYNQNWHMKIGYTVDRFLFNLCMQESIFIECINKFDYESNSRHHAHNNISDNNRNKELLQQMKQILAQYPLNNIYEKNYNLSNRILKYFASCSDSNREKIIQTVQSEHFLTRKRDLIDAPILSIVALLNELISKGADLISNISLENHIQINWNRTQSFEINEDDTELYKNIYIEKEKEVHGILQEFKKQWDICYNKIGNDTYSIKFKSFSQFDKFRKHALQLSKPYYIFEGDVLDIVNNYTHASGIVEIELESFYGIPNTLAKILGQKEPS